jgi:hypothetical protein
MMNRRWRTAFEFILSAAWAVLLCSCAEPGPESGGPLHDMKDWPAGTSLPGLTLSPEGPALLFAEERGDTVAIRWSQWADADWSTPVTIVKDTGLLVNWADRPSMAFGPQGDAHAHWLRMDPRGDFCYGIETAHSTDGGLTWSEADRPHRDTAVAEHGFAQWMPTRDGAMLAWLDGRQFDGHPNPAKAPMEVRAARWTPALGWSDEVVLDSSACTCCPMASAALSGGGYLLTYRDRTEDEIRDFSAVEIASTDVHSVQLMQGPVPVGSDGWQIAGCPVNGSALASGSDRTLAVWFTNAEDQPRIRMAWRSSEGLWSEVENLQRAGAVGRVAAAVDGQGVFHAVWMERDGDVPRLMGQCWTPGGDPLLEAPMALTDVDDARAGGFPSLVGFDGGGVMLAWTTTGKEAHVRSATWTPSP